MTLAATALVLSAALLHALWNAILKVSGERLLTMAVLLGVGATLAALALPFVPAPSPTAWRYLWGTFIIHQIYFIGLLKAYEHGDFSLAYPIARGSAPALVALVSGALLDEPLAPAVLFGVVTISFGIMTLTLDREVFRRTSRRSWFYIALTAVSIAVYTVVDGSGVRQCENPLTYVLWMTAIEGAPIALYAVITRRRYIGVFAKKHGKQALIAAIAAPVAYGMVLYAYTLGPIAASASLRETSVLFAAWFGSRVLREHRGNRRIVASVVILVGMVLIHGARH